MTIGSRSLLAAIARAELVDRHDRSSSLACANAWLEDALALMRLR
jgi:hypothetical protein